VGKNGIVLPTLLQSPRGSRGWRSAWTNSHARPSSPTPETKYVRNKNENSRSCFVLLRVGGAIHCDAVATKIELLKALALRCFEYTYIIVYTVEVVTSLAFMWLISRAALNAAAKRLKSHDVTYDITWRHMTSHDITKHQQVANRICFTSSNGTSWCHWMPFCPRLCCALPPSQASFTASSCFRDKGKA